MDQPIFSKLLAAHSVQSFPVDVPGPTQHLVGQVFLARMFVGLFLTQDIPECHQQFASYRRHCLVGMLVEKPPGAFDDSEITLICPSEKVIGMQT